MNRRRRVRLVLATALLVVNGPRWAAAETIAVVSAAAVKAPLTAAQVLLPASDRLDLAFGTAGAVRDRMVAGAPADIVVLPPARLDELVAQGLVEAEGRKDLGVVRLGIAVRSGAPRPAIANESDVRAALGVATTIGLADPASGATTGIFFAGLLRRMGLDETLKPKIRLYPDGTAAMEALARGEIAVAAGQISEIEPVHGVDLVGPLPEAMQLKTTYAAGIAKRARAPALARRTIDLLTSTAMAPAFAAAGFDPPAKP